MATGAMAISVANPTDVVKIRLQAQGRLPPDQRPYKGSMDCYSKIIADKGVKGLWIGVVPNIMRNSIINAAELASYDQIKQVATQKLGMNSAAISTHIFCAFGAGFFCRFGGDGRPRIGGGLGGAWRFAPWARTGRRVLQPALAWRFLDGRRAAFPLTCRARPIETAALAP